LKAKLISVLGGGLLCFAALPWSGATTLDAQPIVETRSGGPTAPVAATPVKAAVLTPFTPTVVERAGVSADVMGLALRSVRCAVASGEVDAPKTLTLIDYSLPSVEPRLWVFDYATGELLYKELVAHGRNTGDNMARHFSDRLNSRQSSIGLFVTDDTYIGSNGYSLRLDGLEPGFNAHARDRAIVMHGAPYVNAALATSQGRIGRSWGCPALREAVARDVIDTIRGGGVIFSYYPDEQWLKTSRFLTGCGGTEA
jgi:hypothetical protein